MSGWGGEEERWSVLHTVMNLRFALGADLLTADRMLCFQWGLCRNQFVSVGKVKDGKNCNSFMPGMCVFNDTVWSSPLQYDFSQDSSYHWRHTHTQFSTDLETTLLWTKFVRWITITSRVAGEHFPPFLTPLCLPDSLWHCLQSISGVQHFIWTPPHDKGCLQYI